MEMLKIAIPNKGRLSEKIYGLLSAAGLNFPSKDERTLQVTTKDKKYSIIFVRTADIPKFLEDGVADVGFTGFDIVTELNSDVDKVMDLAQENADKYFVYVFDNYFTHLNSMPEFATYKESLILNKNIHDFKLLDNEKSILPRSKAEASSLRISISFSR